MNRIINLYWKIYFSSYYVAKDLNKKNDPPWSACYYMTIIFINIFSGVFFFSSFIYGEKLPFFEVIIISYVLLSYFLNQIISPKHKKMIKKYEYLSEPELKGYRFLITFGVLLLALLIMSIGAFSMNKGVQSFFRSLF